MIAMRIIVSGVSLRLCVINKKGDMRVRVNEDKKIEDLIKEAYKETIWLPEFQRPFVWDNNQIRMLVDSLFHNYTISSILSWKGKNELARRRVGGSVKDIKVPDKQTENDEIVYLLDGQQRTTALTYVFTNKEIFKANNKTKSKIINLYWDSEYHGNEVEDRWIFDDEVIYENTTEKHYKISDHEAKDQLITNFGTRYIKMKDAFENDINTIISKIQKQNPNLLGDYLNKIQELKTRILNRKVVEIEQSGDLNTVLDVFERINTKNTKLSIFDIMVAKTYKKYDEGYFDLRSFFKIVTSNTKSIDNNYFRNLVNKDNINEQRVFDESTILYLIMVAIKQKFRANEVLNISTDEFIHNIKPLHFLLNRLCEVMENVFYIEESEQNKYQPIAKFLIAFLTKFSKQETEIKFKTFLHKWYWNTIIYNRYPGSQNEKIERDFKRVIENEVNLNNALILMEADNSRTFHYIEQSSIQSLFNCYYNKKADQIYKMMLVLFKSKQPKDFYSGVLPSKEGTKKTFLEEHHIFPTNSNIGKNIIEKYASINDNIINNIANITLITKETNTKRISNKNPSVYISEFLEEKRDLKQEDLFYEYLETHFINKVMVGYLLDNDFESFIISRTKLIYEYMNSLT